MKYLKELAIAEAKLKKIKKLVKENKELFLDGIAEEIIDAICE